jgi:hypothetical protein
LELPLLETHGFLAATMSSSDATTGGSRGGHSCCTILSSIADCNVALHKMEEKQKI